MAPPIYFFPKVTRAQLVRQGKLNREILVERGLARTFADVEAEKCAYSELTGLGPGNFSGSLLCALPVDGECPIRLHYAPTLQDWHEFDAYFVGIDKEHPPTPECLKRKDQFNGYPIELGHAKAKWVLPIIRDPDGGTRLPRDWTLEADGSVSETIRADYIALWEEFGEVVDLFFSPDDPGPAGVVSMDRDRAMQLCLKVLGLNYRIGRAEQNLLGLVNAETWVTILAASVDVYTFWAIYQETQDKKKRRDADRLAELVVGPGSTGTSPGSPVGCPDIGPAEASSTPPPSDSAPGATSRTTIT